MQELEIYGTLGPSCHEKELLKAMIMAGMSGVRLNLSHVNLDACEQWLKELQQAKEETGRNIQLLIDMKGPELRIGKLAQPLLLKEGGEVSLGKEIPVPSFLFSKLTKGQQILLDDGKYLLEVLSSDDASALCRIIHGGLLHSSKSMALPGKSIQLPALTESDIYNLKLAERYGVSGIMQPFVRCKEDLLEVRKVLAELHLEHLKIYAKIENREGAERLEEILPHCDCIVIARGDLGNAVTLWELPTIQMQIQELCHRHSKPYMVVTQMLHSMIEHPTPTRAEVSDIFYAVYHGASAIMLTGETAAGAYPLEAMTYFVKTAESARSMRMREKNSTKH